MGEGVLETCNGKGYWRHVMERVGYWRDVMGGTREIKLRTIGGMQWEVPEKCANSDCRCTMHV